MPSLEEQEAAAAREAGITGPAATPPVAAPGTAGQRPPESDPPSRFQDDGPVEGESPAKQLREIGLVDPEEALHAADDETQRRAIRVMVEQYKDVDDTMRRKVLKRPLAGLLRKPSRLETLDEAANILIDELDPQQRDRVEEIARENGFPVWVVVLGSVSRAADLQELASGDFKSEWLNKGTTSDTTKPQAAPKCMHCGFEIPGARRGQQACCSRHGVNQDAHNEDCPIKHVVKIGERWVAR